MKSRRKNVFYNNINVDKILIMHLTELLKYNMTEERGTRGKELLYFVHCHNEHRSEIIHSMMYEISSNKRKWICKPITE